MRAIRVAAQGHEPPIHLFQYGPLFGAMLLGSAWNRMPATQLYDDAPPEYTPTYLIGAS
jgi:SMODS-associated and fused to various effectors sensor domain